MRQPAVADRFYPAAPKALKRAISEFLPTDYNSNKEKAIAIVSPHAGYIYSGELAAKTMCSVKIPETVIILGVNHRGGGTSVALS
ncbi:MAG: AmmeMemoRadiSam system protein B, partial [Desulfobulbaceae bacterium]|nr:AmmeMemoRadiSam system protein B [Desulfobulbaceae bacterium]